MGYVYLVTALAAWTALPFVYRRAGSAGASPTWLMAGLGLAAMVLDVAAIPVLGADPTGASTALLIIALAGGLTMSLAVLAFVETVARGELAISWTILTLGFALVAAMCMAYPGERPTATGLAGLAMAIAAVVLLGLDMRRRQQSGTAARSGRRWGLFMALAFLANVASLYLTKLGADRAVADAPAAPLGLVLVFLAVFHGSSGASGLVLALLGRGRGSASAALGWGSVGGAALFFVGAGVMLAMSAAAMPGYLVYPISNGGSALAVTALSVIFLREHPGWPGRVGIATGVAALVLLGIAAS